MLSNQSDLDRVILEHRAREEKERARKAKYNEMMIERVKQWNDKINNHMEPYGFEARKKGHDVIEVGRLIFRERDYHPVFDLSCVIRGLSCARAGETTELPTFEIKASISDRILGVIDRWENLFPILDTIIAQGGRTTDDVARERLAHQRRNALADKKREKEEQSEQREARLGIVRGVLVILAGVLCIGLLGIFSN